MPYDPKLSLTLAQHAVAIYDLSNGYERWARGQGFNGADIVERGATQIGIAYRKDRIVIAARGSSQFGDWLDDFFFFRWRWRFVRGRIHAGIRRQADRAALEVRSTVAELLSTYPAAKIYVTGHSLGGALASLLCCVLERNGIRTEAVYTFESPRVGNSEWGTWYDSAYGADSYRIVNINEGEQDIVTRVPLSRFGWCHVGQPVMLCGGVAYQSEAAWEAYRAAHPIGILANLRIVRRAWRGVSAHFGAMLLAELRRQSS